MTIEQEKNKPYYLNEIKEDFSEVAENHGKTKNNNSKTNNFTKHKREKVRIQCPNCQEQYYVPADMASQTVNCKCGIDLEIPKKIPAQFVNQNQVHH
ncbi:MAG: hypothetical protein GY750_14160 [Lentisphaerae bacterium]|nr:hypothetical protein [Lentisphaerota bacterium]MCP4102544.1 hypothetical protein [Lentisphaerota bacterium]